MLRADNLEASLAHQIKESGVEFTLHTERERVAVAVTAAIDRGSLYAPDGLNISDVERDYAASLGFAVEDPKRTGYVALDEVERAVVVLTAEKLNRTRLFEGIQGEFTDEVPEHETDPVVLAERYEARLAGLLEETPIEEAARTIAMIDIHGEITETWALAHAA